jgi:hypothetical protein
MARFFNPQGLDNPNFALRTEMDTGPVVGMGIGRA